MELDKQLRLHLKLVLEIVRVANDAVNRNPANRGSVHDAASSSDQVLALLRAAKQTALQLRAQANAVLSILASQLQNFSKQCMTPATCPADLVAMGGALQRLQQWEGLPGDHSIVDQIVLLEELLSTSSDEASSRGTSSPAASSSAQDIAGSQQKAGTLLKLLGKHHDRVNNAGSVICKQLDQVGFESP